MPWRKNGGPQCSPQFWQAQNRPDYKLSRNQSCLQLKLIPQMCPKQSTRHAGSGRCNSELWNHALLDGICVTTLLLKLSGGRGNAACRVTRRTVEVALHEYCRCRTYLQSRAELTWRAT
eukprot:4645812-Pleurochrysis_carterae.AAC.1